MPTNDVALRGDGIRSGVVRSIRVCGVIPDLEAFEPFINLYIIRLYHRVAVSGHLPALLGLNLLEDETRSSCCALLRTGKG